MIPNRIPGHYERKSGERSRKSTFVIATEGEKTEPNYFAYLDREYADINIIILPADDGQSQPYQVLDKLLCKKQELENEGVKSYQYWIVIDHDHRPYAKLKQVMDDAEANQVFVADSNPCFEVWLIQHFRSLTDIVELSPKRQVKRCKSVTDEHLKHQDFDPGYNKRRLDRSIYIPKVSSAIDNAEFDEDTASDLDAFTYTGSRVYKLVKDILSHD